jgi:hypothetical protein
MSSAMTKQKDGEAWGLGIGFEMVEIEISGSSHWL